MYIIANATEHTERVKVDPRIEVKWTTLIKHSSPRNLYIHPKLGDEVATTHDPIERNDFGKASMMLSGRVNRIEAGVGVRRLETPEPFDVGESDGDGAETVGQGEDNLDACNTKT